MENLETEVLGMLSMLDAYKLHCAFRIVGLDAREERKIIKNYFLNFFLKSSILKKWRRVKMGEPRGFKNFMTI